MSTNEKREGNFLKTLGAFIAVAVGAVTLIASTASFTKAYYQTPMKLEQYERQIADLQSVDAANAVQMREMHDLLLEIRTDLKYVKRATVE